MTGGTFSISWGDRLKRREKKGVGFYPFRGRRRGAQKKSSSGGKERGRT